MVQKLSKLVYSYLLAMGNVMRVGLFVGICVFHLLDNLTIGGAMVNANRKKSLAMENVMTMA